MKSSTWRWTLWSTRLSGSKPYSWSAGFTSQAMRHFWSLASNLVIGPAPLLAAMMFFQLVSTSAPSGGTSPRPVTTTRRMASLQMQQAQTRSGLSLLKPCTVYNVLRSKGSRSTSSRRTDFFRSALVLVDIIDRVTNRGDLFCSVIRNFDSELFFECHHQLDDVEAVRAKIIDEARVLGDLVGFDAEMFDDDLLHPIGSLAHVGLPPLCFCGSPSDALGWLQVAVTAAPH